jgi:hypothetical protein
VPFCRDFLGGKFSQASFTVLINWERGGGEWCGRPGQQSPGCDRMGGKMNILNEKFSSRQILNY